MERDKQPAEHGRSKTDHTICVIPARGGSKSIPKKNLARIGKWSLLEHTIADAYPLRCPIYVTTDNNEIGFLAQEADAVYVKRPEELAEDDSRTEDAVKNVLERLSVPSEAIVVLLQCTSPFRFPGELKDAVDYVKKDQCDSLFSAYKIQQFVWEDERRIHYSASERPPRQLKIPLYVEDGSFYISRAWCYYEHNNRLAGRIGKWIHDKIYGLEVDEWTDLEIAQQLYPWLKKSGRL